MNYTFTVVTPTVTPPTPFLLTQGLTNDLIDGYATGLEIVDVQTRKYVPSDTVAQFYSYLTTWRQTMLNVSIGNFHTTSAQDSSDWVTPPALKADLLTWFAYVAQRDFYTVDNFTWIFTYTVNDWTSMQVHFNRMVNDFVNANGTNFNTVMTAIRAQYPFTHP